MCKKLSAKKGNVVILGFVRKAVCAIILKIEAENEPCKYGQKYIKRLGIQMVEIHEDKRLLMA